MSHRLTVALIVLVGAAACSAPPEKERQQAESALHAAREADAAAFAPEPLHAAEAALLKYDEAVAQRDYRLALNDALEARDRAYEAVKQAGARKTELRTQAERLATDLEAEIKTGTARLTQHPTGASAERLRAALRTATSALQEARTLLTNHEYEAAATRLKPVVAALRAEAPPPEATAAKKKK